MLTSRISRGLFFLFPFLLLVAAGTALVSCTSSGSDSREIQFSLNDSLKNYSKVVITLVDAKDSTHVLDTAFSGKLADPKSLAPFQVPDSISGNFIIRIQGFNDKGELTLQSNITVTGGSAGAPVKLPPEKLPGLIQTLSSARLSGLELSAGTLDPVFKSDVFAYNVDLPFEDDSLAVNAVAADTQASLTLEGAVLQSGLSSASVGINVGANVIRIGVKPKGADSSNYYVITVKRKSGGEARLDSLLLSTGNMTPAFNPDVHEYTVAVGPKQDSLFITPYAKESRATVTVAGNALAGIGIGAAVALEPGITLNVPVKVTSPDSTTSVTYTISVTRALSADAALSSITLSDGSLVPQFDPDLDKYTATVAKASISVIPVSRQANSKITVDGQPVASGVPSQVLNLDVGLTAFIVAVTAPDGKTKRSYSLTFNRASPDAFLTGMSLSGISFDTAFQVDRFHYSASVPRATDKVTLITSMTTQIKALDMTINGAAVTDLTTGTGILKTVTGNMSLNVGKNSVQVIVTAPDGITKNTYSIDILRKPNTVADLSVLGFGSGVLKPLFAPAIINYEDTVTTDVTSIILTAKALDPNAMVIFRLLRPEVVIKPLAKTSASENVEIGITPPLLPRYVLIRTDTLTVVKPTAAMALNQGINLVEVQVIAEDGVTTKTYSVFLFRRYSANAQLSDLSVTPTGSTTPLTLSPVFDSKTVSYSTSTLSGFVTVTPTIAEPMQTVTVNGVAVASGKPSASITLVNGANIIQVAVTAPDGKSKLLYTVVVNKIILFIPK